MCHLVISKIFFQGVAVFSSCFQNLKLTLGSHYILMIVRWAAQHNICEEILILIQFISIPLKALLGYSSAKSTTGVQMSIVQGLRDKQKRYRPPQDAIQVQKENNYSF